MSTKETKAKELLQNPKPFYIGRAEEHNRLSDPLDRLYLAESIINVTKTALAGLEDGYGKEQINSIDLPCSLSDAYKCLDMAVRLSLSDLLRF